MNNMINIHAQFIRMNHTLTIACWRPMYNLDDIRQAWWLVEQLKTSRPAPNAKHFDCDVLMTCFGWQEPRWSYVFSNFDSSRFGLVLMNGCSFCSFVSDPHCQHNRPICVGAGNIVHRTAWTAQMMGSGVRQIQNLYPIGFSGNEIWRRVKRGWAFKQKYKGPIVSSSAAAVAY